MVPPYLTSDAELFCHPEASKIRRVVLPYSFPAYGGWGNILGCIRNGHGLRRRETRASDTAR